MRHQLFSILRKLYSISLIFLVRFQFIPQLLLLPTLTACTHVAVRQLAASDTRNDLYNNPTCKALTIIFARGTDEPGNVGEIAGPPLFNALKRIIGIGGLAVQGVSYSADIFGFFEGGDAEGSEVMKDLVEYAMERCPETRIVMGGYSQGGQLVHNVAQQFSVKETAAISSVVLFGDPKNGDSLGNIPASKIKIFCHDGDDICTEHGLLVSGPHLNYNLNAEEAALFIAKKAGFSQNEWQV